MRLRLFPLLVILAGIFGIFSCTGGDSPVTPANEELVLQNSATSANTHLWGLYDCWIDVETEEVKVIPLRTAMFACNVTSFVDGPPSNLIIDINSIDTQSGTTDISVDVGLRHPFPGLNMYTGFDVIGVFMGTYTDLYPGPIQWTVTDHNGQHMLNPDGYTRWFNRLEFGSVPLPLLGYTPGVLGSPGTSSPSIEDFPPEANADEALVIDIVDYSTVYIINPADFGGEVRLELTVWDWSAETSGVMGEYVIRCYSEAWWFGGGVDMTPIASSDHCYTYLTEIPVQSIESTAPLTVWIEVNYPQLDYSNEFGIENDAQGELCSYFMTEVEVSTEPPSYIEVLTPNGGEEWDVGATEDITWDSEYITGTVFIEYSKDGFVSDIHTIAVDEDNDGSYTWDIPCDESDAVRARVTSTDDPLVTDTSDGDFAIVGAGWAGTWGGISLDASYETATDESGSVYVTGEFRYTVDFDPGPGIDEHSALGSSDSFLSKFNSCGEFVWALTWGVAGGNGWGNGVSCDNAGNVIVMGTFRGANCDFDPGPGTDYHSTTGMYDCYLSKFNSDGDLLWCRTWGGTYYESSGSPQIDGSDNIYVMGGFRSSSVDFDPGSGTDWRFNAGGDDCWLSKFNSSGEFQWVRTWGAGGWDTAYDGAADSSGNVYVAGRFQGTVDFDPGSGTDNHTAVDYDLFLTKFDTNGTHEWAATWDGIAGWNSGATVALNGTNVYCGGYFIGTVDFDPGVGTDYHTSAGNNDCFVSRFNVSGIFQEVAVWGGTGNDVVNGLAIDSVGNVLVCGQFFDFADFDPGTGTENRTSNGYYDIFLSKLDSSLEYIWVQTWGGSQSDYGADCAVGPGDVVYSTGFFNATVDFDPGPTVEDWTSNGSADVYIVKVMDDGEW